MMIVVAVEDDDGNTTYAIEHEFSAAYPQGLYYPYARLVLGKKIRQPAT